MSADFTSRLVGMVVLAILGARLGVSLSQWLEMDVPPEMTGMIFSMVGALTGLVVTPWLTIRPLRAARERITMMPAENLLGSVMGLTFGLILAALLSVPLSLLPVPFNQVLPSASALVLAYLSTVIFSGRAGDIINLLRISLGPGGSQSSPDGGRRVLLDTSVIIDGRIADIHETGFIGGTLLVPRFVLAELQHIADSADTIRRNRGRRGLEVLERLKRNPLSPVQILDADVEGTREVDDKLIQLARQMHVPIMTNDYNLNRVAELQGVQVLNLNDLANAVKAVFLPGETMTLHIIQEGREINQGVGYLDDGTMVVVEEGKRYIDRNIEVVVTKVLQTSAGRMIFARPKDLVKPGRGIH